EPVNPWCHVGWPGDGGHGRAAVLQQILDGHSGAADVIRVDVGELVAVVVAERAPGQDYGDSEAVQVERPAAVHAGQQCSIHVTAAQVPGGSLIIARRVHGEQHELDVAEIGRA